MRTTLYLALALSLLGNGILLGLARRGSAEALTRSVESRSASATLPTADSSTLKALPEALPTPSDSGKPVKNLVLTDPRAVAAKMKSEGYADPTILSAAAGAAQEQNNAEYVWTEALAAQPWAPGSAEAKATFAQLDKELGALFTELSSDLPDAVFSPQRQARSIEHLRQLTYGDLSGEKLTAIKEIESAYNGRAFPPGPAQQAAQVKDWSDVESRIRKVLSPEEADDYFRYNTSLAGSPTARLQQVLRTLVVDQITYKTLADRANELTKQMPLESVIQSLDPLFRQLLGARDYESIARDISRGGAGGFLMRPVSN